MTLAWPHCGGDFDHWDLEVRGGRPGAARMFVAVEYHGDGRQLLRMRWSPRGSMSGAALTGLFARLSLAWVQEQSWVAGFVLGATALLFGLRMLFECAAATGAFLAAVRTIEREEEEEPYDESA